MKFSLSTLALAAIAPLSALAAPVARAAAASPVGYASLNGGTTGGAGGKTTTVTTYDALAAAVKDDAAAIVYVKGTITGTDKIRVGSNKSILGVNSSSKLVGAGFFVKGAKNVIIRNLAISKVKAAAGDAVGIQSSTNVWLDHLDLSSDRDNGKDYYDGLADLSHAADFVTISNTYFHDHYKASLVGHSDNNGAEDKGHLRITYIGNHWKNINSRTPSLRFGTGHIVNNYFDTQSTGVDTRDGAQVLVESSVFVGVKDPVGSLYSDDLGYAVTKDLDLGGAAVTAPKGTLNTVPYTYTALGSAKVKAAVVGVAGNTLTLA